MSKNILYFYKKVIRKNKCVTIKMILISVKAHK